MTSTKKKGKRLLIISGTIFAFVVLCCLACDWIVGNSLSERAYSKVSETPHREVGLVLGTSPVSVWTGRRNFIFDERIKSAADLYKAHKIDRIIVSGGDYRKNEKNGFDEPVAMRDSLIKHGVDSNHIVLDYDGTRTLNSIAKIREVYHKDSIMVISQEFHNARALYQARHLGIDAVAFNARTPVGRRSPVWWRNRLREVLARVKCIFEMAKPPTIEFRSKQGRQAPPPVTKRRNGVIERKYLAICGQAGATVLPV